MAGAGNDTTQHLADVREMLAEFEVRFDKLSALIDDRVHELKKELVGIRRYVRGETVLAQYASAGVDKRLDDIERRVKALEQERTRQPAL